MFIKKFRQKCSNVKKLLVIDQNNLPIFKYFQLASKVALQTHVGTMAIVPKGTVVDMSVSVLRDMEERIAIVSELEEKRK